MPPDSTTPGEITTPYPTITNLAVEWRIEGDDNLNATCGVRYRKIGDTAWREENAAAPGSRRIEPKDLSDHDVDKSP